MKSKKIKKSDDGVFSIMDFLKKYLIVVVGVVLVFTAFCVVLLIVYTSGGVGVVELAAKQILFENGIDEKDITYESKMNELCVILEEARKNGAFDETKKRGMMLIKKNNLKKESYIAEKKQVTKEKREQPREIKGMLKEFIDLAVND